jgi:ABC-type Zn uptake system ZnuABC Zn-binding protein ZnuA
MKAGQRWFYGCFCLFIILAAVSCAAAGQPEQSSAEPVNEDDHAAEALPELALPPLEAADLAGRKLRVVATTTIIGDVVAQVGGDAITLTTLLGSGQDPHSYEPSASDLTAVADADVIFVNGWDLEEGLVRSLENVSGGTPLLPVSAHITPLAFTGEHEAAAGGEAEHGHSGADPHVWSDPYQVQQWVENIQQVLSDLDPANAAIYEGNAAAYQAELASLMAYVAEQVATIPADRRKLVTNHESLGYFAARYGFAVIGTVIPGASTLAEPSASSLADLVGKMAVEEVCTIFVENIANEQLARAAAAELDHCQQVQVVALYTDAIGLAGSGADSYIGMMRANVDALVSGLK